MTNSDHRASAVYYLQVSMRCIHPKEVTAPASFDIIPCLICLAGSQIALINKVEQSLRWVIVAGAPKVKPCGGYRLSLSILFDECGGGKLKTMPWLESITSFGFSCGAIIVWALGSHYREEQCPKRTVASTQSQLFEALMWMCKRS